MLRQPGRLSIGPPNHYARRMRLPHSLIVLAGLLLLKMTYTLPAAQPTEEQLRWLESDELAPPEFQVNMGELEFLATPPDKPVPHSDNTFWITPATLENGWLKLRQCHENLDPVPELEVTYQYRQMRDLTIVESRNIDYAEVIANSVQMSDLRRGNRLCVEAQIRVLYREDNHYKLVNGPYHRRFLDGYYPYHVTLRVHYPAEQLEPISVEPRARPGLTVRQQTGQLTIEAWFEGRLMTEVIFSRHN